MESNKWSKIIFAVLGNGITWFQNTLSHSINSQQVYLLNNVSIYFSRLWWVFSIFMQNIVRFQSLKKWSELVLKEKLKFGSIKIMVKIILKTKPFNCTLQKISNLKAKRLKDKASTFWKDKWSKIFWALLTKNIKPIRIHLKWN